MSAFIRVIWVSVYLLRALYHAVVNLQAEKYGVSAKNAQKPLFLRRHLEKGVRPPFFLLE